MWFTKTSEGMRGWLTLRNNDGTIRAGEPAGTFTATVVNPGDSSSNTPVVSESAEKPGLYTFLVPAGFLTVVGVYAIVLEVDTGNPQRVRDVKTFPMRVTIRDLDNVLDVVVDSGDGSKTALEALQIGMSMASGAFIESTVGLVKTFVFTDRAGVDLFAVEIDSSVNGAGVRIRTLG